ncbi:MAG TPA: Xaa-Pro aminopeptidase [Gemmatimonadaceae bacterium]|nr:Xaa-Pro aminopeptidase [Gemmatimonadaceae bacterium]
MFRRLLLIVITAATCLAAPLGAQVSDAEYAARRDSLFAALEDGVTIVFGADEPDPDYLPWQQARGFLYLTGFDEPGAALVMVEHDGAQHELLFVREKNPAEEVWTGKRLGVAAVRETLGLEGRNASTLPHMIDSLRQLGGRLYGVGDVERISALGATDANAAVDLLRGQKSLGELVRLQIAAEISAQGHLEVMRTVRPGIAEFQIEALAEYIWRSAGADGPGYTSIVGSGPNATTLHYGENSRTAQDGEVIVMDMAAAFDGYSADITRTVPVNGTFSPAQREIYTIVLDAQKAAERQVRAGGPARAMSDSAGAVLRAGLARIGLIDAPDARYECGSRDEPRQCSQLSLYYMHGLGHGIGLDVHDPDQYYATGTIDVGSAFTIEPGIYVRSNLLEIIPDTERNRAFKQRIAQAFAKYAGIGVRIEDDYLVTENGVLRPSAGVPREIDEVEAELAKPRPPLLPVRVIP